MIKSLYLLSGIINSFLLGTMSQSHLSKFTDNILMMHYFIFNILTSMFSFVPTSMCNLNGYGQQISALGSVISFALLVIRANLFTGPSLKVWISMLWFPVTLFSLLAFSEPLQVFVPVPEQEGLCVKHFKDGQRLWIVISCFSIFLNVLTLLLSVNGCLTMVYGQETSTRRKQGLLRLFTTILFDTTLSCSSNTLGLMFEINPYHKLGLIFGILSTIRLLRLNLVPLFFISVHPGVRGELIKWLTRIPKTPIKNTNRSQMEDLSASTSLVKPQTYSSRIQIPIEEYHIIKAGSIERLNGEMFSETRSRSNSNVPSTGGIHNPMSGPVIESKIKQILFGSKFESSKLRITKSMEI